MNLTSSNAPAGTWKRIQLQHIALVFGLVIATSAIGAIGASERGSESPAVRDRVPSLGAKPRASASPMLFYVYVFGSKQDAELFRSGVPSQDGFTTLVVDTTDSEELLHSLFWDLAHHAPDARIVDMRGRMGGDVYVGPGSEYHSESYAPLRPVLP